MTKTNVYMNQDSATFTPNGGSLVALTEIEDVKWDVSAKPVTWQAGTDRGPRLKVHTDRTRSVTLSGANIFQLASTIDPDVEGTLVVVLHDMKNQAGGVGSGQVTLTLINCSRDKVDFSGKHNAIAMANATFTAVWSDGQTDPLSFAQA